jgi:polyhydroxybutyrate depolymerase
VRRGVLRHTAPWHLGFRPVVVSVAVVTMVISVASCSAGRSAGSSEGGRRVAPSSGCERRAAARGAVPAGREQTRTLDAGSVRGSYQLAVARTYRSRTPAPLVLLFYGFGSGPAQFSSLTGLPSRGSRRGYLVAVPHTQGAESEWQFNAHGTDARFVDGLVASLEHAYCIDTNAVFATGFSAGAAFTIIYSCAREDRIAAIATVAVDYQLGCTRPISIMAFHGTEDPLVPYQNGAIGLSLPGVKVRGTELNMGDWARLDRCRVTPRQTRTGSQVIRQEWSGCARKTSVVLYTIVGGGHSWPGANPKLAVGLTTQQVSATSQILSFFDGVRR